MKIRIIQIVLGLGILIAMALSIAWDPTGFYIRESLGEPGSWKIIFNPDTKEIVATILAFLVLLLGLAIIGVSIALLITKIRSEYGGFNSEINRRVKNLVFTQMGLGFLVSVSAFLVTIWGFPTSYFYPGPDNRMHGVFFMPGHQFIWAQNMSVLIFLISIPTIGFSIAQLRSARLSRARAIGISREE
jgi:hypothetical protein